MRSMFLSTIAALALASTVIAAPCRDAGGNFIKCPAVIVVKHPNCKVGIPCGNSCISKDKVCHK
jgi:hypothetical protein